MGSWGLGFALCWWLLASAGLGHGAPLRLLGRYLGCVYPFLAGYTLRCREGAGSFMRVTLSLHLPLRLPGVTPLVTFPPTPSILPWRVSIYNHPQFIRSFVEEILEGGGGHRRRKLYYGYCNTACISYCTSLDVYTQPVGLGLVVRA